MFLVSLGMLAWRTAENANRDLARRAQLQHEIKSVEARLRLDQPAIHQAILNTGDEFHSIHALRVRSIEHFELLRRKYSTLEPRGAGEFSLREIPALRTDTQPAPVIFRMWVPEERPVWLKLGVHRVQRSVHAYRDPADEHDLVTDSPFTPSGPFEMQLPPGDQTLTIATGPVAAGAQSLVITLGDKVLLRSSFMSAEVTGASSSRISATSQLDFGPQRELPSLVTTRMNLRATASGKAPDDTYAVSMWLSDRASRFTSFPNK